MCSFPGTKTSGIVSGITTDADATINNSSSNQQRSSLVNSLPKLGYEKKYTDGRDMGSRARSEGRQAFRIALHGGASELAVPIEECVSPAKIQYLVQTACFFGSTRTVS